MIQGDKMNNGGNMRQTTLLMLILALTFLVFAEELEPRPNLEGQIKLFLVDGDDITKHIPNTPVVSGSILKYEITYTNSGDAVAKNAEFQHPVPDGMEYIAESANGGNILFSIDDGKTFMPEPVKYTEMTNSGEEIERIASPNMYDIVKWVLDKPIKVDESVILSFEVNVKDGNK